jgi:hypothetical protein
MQEMNTEVQVVKLLQDNAPNTMGPTEVSEALNINLGTVKWLMSKMATENKIMRVKRGQYAPSGSMNPQVGPSSAQGATAVNGGIIVNTVTPAMPGLPRHLQGLPTPSGQMLVTDEEIEAALADDDGFGGVDDDDAEDAAEDE